MHYQLLFLLLVVPLILALCISLFLMYVSGKQKNEYQYKLLLSRIEQELKNEEKRQAAKAFLAVVPEGMSKVIRNTSIPMGFSASWIQSPNTTK